MKPRNPSLLACMAAVACGGISPWPMSDISGPSRRRAILDLRTLMERRGEDTTDGRKLARVKKLCRAVKPKCPNRRKKR